MADKKISDLNSATDFVSTTADLLVLVQSGETKKMTPAAFNAASRQIITTDLYSSAGAISNTADVSRITLGAGIVYTFGTAPTTGQAFTKTFVVDAASGAGTASVSLTAAATAASASLDVISFTAVGQSATVKYVNSKWYIVSLVGATAA